MHRLVILLGLVACAQKQPPVAAPEAPEAAAEDPTELSARMQEHYTFATAILSAAVRGDFDEARARAATLAEMDTPEGLPITWKGGFASMRAHAATVAAAETDADLAQRAATLGRQCAACHTNLEPPEITPAELAASGWAGDADASPHAAATYQMWVGLFFPDDPTYQAGAAALAESFDPSRLGEGEPPEAATALRPQLESIFADAVGASGPAERTHAFGRVVATCGTCHEAYGVTLSLP